MPNHISIFLPSESIFYRRLFAFLSNAFQQLNFEVSGGYKLLTDNEMVQWVSDKKPNYVFEMNRIKDEIPSLHELNIPHIAWIVDFQGRDETHIKGSDITYFFDPDWDENYTTGGLQDWLPPGTCTDTFFPSKQSRIKECFDFSFIGHIPKPWSDKELLRPLQKDSHITFKTLLNKYIDHLKTTEFELKTHKNLSDIIEKLTKQLVGTDILLPLEIKYDLMERTKRMKNREELISFASGKSEVIAIYGSSNWAKWYKYKKYYKNFASCPNRLNNIHQNTKRNLHDGVSFHFRAIDCMASGGLIFHYNNKSKKKLNQDQKPECGLHNFFNKKSHFIEFQNNTFDNAFEISNQLEYAGSKAQKETRKIIAAHHTWRHRAKKIISDINRL